MSTHRSPNPEVAFLPVADPERRQLDPMGALAAARELRTLIGAAEYDAVDWARRADWTWAQIGEVMGTSRQAAQQRFGVPGYDVVEAQTCPNPGECGHSRHE
jgi:hypothetical protein